ncbi:hypothetical protein [Alkalihalobacillus sp. CinArs1]|uniref:hypothetical protein n=1 Tax=Alkalihalobacillus sp. CinArs1 TaxID=2995314 RepID=UPI0022DE3822|nr:hypothetical protein [Alkalihalobacillus sp. CinArs1]
MCVHIKSILKVTLTAVTMTMGCLVGLMAFGYKMLILSDIPVSFTTTEAIWSQTFFFVSTLLLAIALMSLKSKLGRGISLGVLVLIFLFNLLVLKTDITNDSAAVAQLQLAPVLHIGFLVVINLFLLMDREKRR